MSTPMGPAGPGPLRPRQGTALLAALVAIAVAAAAIMTRPDLPPALLAGLSVFGSVLVGGAIIIPILGNRDDA
jgi:hypothetical protein